MSCMSYPLMIIITGILHRWYSSSPCRLELVLIHLKVLYFVVIDGKLNVVVYFTTPVHAVLQIFNSGIQINVYSPVVIQSCLQSDHLICCVADVYNTHAW